MNHPHLLQSAHATIAAMWTGAAWWYVCRLNRRSWRRTHDRLLGRPL
jgi:hypothetical protein